MEEFCGFPFWDTNITWNTSDPYFTPCFERTVLGIAPCLFLWVFGLLDIYFSYNTHTKTIPWTPLNILKLSLTVSLVGLEIGLIVIYRAILPNIFESYENYPVDIFVPAIRTATLLLSIVLLLYSKASGVCSSGVQFIFWLLFGISQAIRFRTVISRHDDSDYPAFALNERVYILEIIYFPIVVLQLFLHCWSDYVSASHEKSTDDVKNVCPESSSSFLSRILFEWFSPLAWKGFRKPLEIQDLWQLNKSDLSQNVVPHFDRHWPGNLNKGLKRNLSTNVFNPTDDIISPRSKVTLAPGYIKHGSIESRKQEQGILITLLKCFGFQYFIGFCMRMCTDLMTFISPQILNLLINFVGSDEPQWKGLLYAGCLLACAITGTIFNANGTHKFYITGMRAKSALVSAVYRKSLLLSSSAKRAESAGEIVNHMAVDIQYVTDFAQFAYLLWSAPLVMGIALYFPWNILGPSALAGVVVMILLLPLNAFLASKIQKLQKEQMMNKDKRTRLMNEILCGMKVLKLYAWEPSFEKQVMKIRQKEIEVQKKTAYLNSVSNFLWTCAPFLVSICSFSAYTLSDPSYVLDAQTAFVSLSLFNIMSSPLGFLPILISGYIQASVSIRRLNKYMNADELNPDDVGHSDTEDDPIVIENGTFGWDRDVETLKDINFRVGEGELVALVGTVGSGKSSLLSALLNEMVKIKGRANIRGNIAYVAQQAWIQNATLRDNILFGEPYDPKKYEKVVEACALKPDFDMLPAGDKTEIGERGINLSGGQKQRISLARAVYSNADVFLFDDPLSAVDAHVGKHIFDKVLGPRGCLRKKTRLLVTHGVVYLPSMDNIYVMSEGRISEFGSYQQLLNKNGHFADFLKQHFTSEAGPVSELKDSDMENGSDDEVGDLALTQIKMSKRTISDSESQFSKDSMSRRRDRLCGSITTLSDRRLSLQSTASGIASAVVETAAEDKLIEAEKSEKEGVKASVYFDYFRAAGWGIVAGTISLYIVFQGFSVGANMWLTEWSNVPVVNGTQDPKARNFHIGIYALLGGLQAISILCATLVMALGTVKSANVLHLQMLKRILRAPLAFFDVTPIGRIVNRFSRDVDSMDNVLPMFLRFLLNGIFNVLAVLIVISVSTPIFAVIIVPVGILYYLIQRFYVSTSRQLKRLESVTRSPIYSHFGETVSGSSTIRAYNQQDRFIRESERKTDLNLTSYFSSVCANRWLQIRLETLGNTVVFFAALFAVLGRDTVNEGLVGLSISYALQIIMALTMLVRFTSDVETNIVAVERLKEYSKAPQEAAWEIPDHKPNTEWPHAGEIRFDQYKTRYRPGLDLILRNVTCTIKPGEKVGVVGRTGAGKSSMTLALFRIIEAAEGSITIDGEDISRLGLHDVRGRITIIPQDPVLFSGSLRINLDPFEMESDETLYHALELSHLKNFVSSLPAGLNYEIAEGGENLSVGQRQLVCLARALLRKTKILVLDEATAAVDLDTDDLIQQTIKKEFKESTVITIAHRLNTIMDSDRVIVLDKGEIQEFDAPHGLLADENSIFSGMVREAGTSGSNVSN